jgi:hypothetical protein
MARRSSLAARWATTLGALAVLAAAPAATLASPRSLIQDCLNNGRIVGHYPQSDYTQALANLPTDVAEYSDCEGVIRRAELALAGGGARRSAAAPANAASAAAAANPRTNPLTYAAPAEQAAVAQARRGGAAAVDAGGGLVRPGVVAGQTSSIFNSLPTPLLIALAALAAVVLAVGVRAARDLVRARRSG